MTSLILTPPVTASAAYVSGYCVGGLLTFSAPVRDDGGIAKLQSVCFLDKNQQSIPMYLLLWKTNPVTAGWTLTDSVSVASPASPLEPFRIVSIAAGDWVSISTCGGVTVADLNMPCNSAVGQGRNIFGALVTTGTPTFTSTSALVLDATFE